MNVKGTVKISEIFLFAGRPRDLRFAYIGREERREGERRVNWREHCVGVGEENHDSVSGTRIADNDFFTVDHCPNGHSIF